MVLLWLVYNGGAVWCGCDGGCVSYSLLLETADGCELLLMDAVSCVGVYPPWGMELHNTLATDSQTA